MFRSLTPARRPILLTIWFALSLAAGSSFGSPMLPPVGTVATVQRAPVALLSSSPSTVTSTFEETPPTALPNRLTSGVKPLMAARLPVIYSPVLKISGPIYDHAACGGTIDNHIYDYGCVGTNNLYLLGHSFTVFRGLNSAYHSGLLKVGVSLFYTDSTGRTWHYRVAEIRHVKATAWLSWKDWATGPLTQPGITLQTCDGPANNPSLYRILVRLYPVK